jgi:Pyridoxamine 5'-phosphate oxidase
VHTEKSPPLIIRDVEASAVADLALAPPRAALAATVDNEIHVLPIDLSTRGDPASSPRMVKVPKDAPDLANRNVVAIADDGPQWFRLRALTVRGTTNATGDRSYELTPKRLTAWDYGSLRNAPTPPQPSTPRQPSFSGPADEDVRPFDSSDLQQALSACRVMILATRSGSGMAFAVPLWCVAHQGRIYATTAASSWTVRNVAASAQVAILLGGETKHDTGRLLVRGRARAVPGMPPPVVLARIACRYYLNPKFAAVELSQVRLWGRRMRYYAQSPPAHVIITPQSATACSAPT